MRCEIVTVGTELLLGQIVDTNSAWLGEQLALAGIDVTHGQTVGDNHDRIVDALRLALGRADAVIACGGLGPTQDDITRDAIATVMGVTLVEDAEVADRILQLFAGRGRRMPANNLRQALVPEGATAIADPQPGTAPGLVCPVGDKVIYAVPGVPYEMQEIVSGAILPDLQRRAGRAAVIRSRTLRTWGESESGLAERLAAHVSELDTVVAAAGSGREAAEGAAVTAVTAGGAAGARAGEAPPGEAGEASGEAGERPGERAPAVTARVGPATVGPASPAAQGGPTLAFLASGIEGIKVRITVKAADEDTAREMLDAEERVVRDILGDLVFGVDDESMEHAVARLLVERGETLAVAESLTGGLVAARLVNVPGASAWFRGGVVAYASDVKHTVLDVPPGPVVSEEAAAAMATGVRRLLGADIGLGVTGVAGPDSQDGQRPGTVFLAVALARDEPTVVPVRLPGDRERVRQFACISLLDMLRRALLSLGSPERSAAPRPGAGAGVG